MSYTYELKQLIKRVETAGPGHLAEKKGLGISEDEPCRRGESIKDVPPLL